MNLYVPIIHGYTSHVLFASQRISITYFSYSFQILKLNQVAVGHATVGHIINLVSNDVHRFEQVYILTHISWVGITCSLTPSGFHVYPSIVDLPTCVCNICLFALCWAGTLQPCANAAYHHCIATPVYAIQNIPLCQVRTHAVHGQLATMACILGTIQLGLLTNGSKS